MIATMKCTAHLNELMTALLMTLVNRNHDQDKSKSQRHLNTIVSTIGFFDLNVRFVSDPYSNPVDDPNRINEVVISNDTISMRGNIDAIDPEHYTLEIL